MELAARENWFYAKVSEGLISPFLCHIELSDNEVLQISREVRQFLRGDAEKFLHLQKLFPLLSVWSICYPLSERYGEDGTHGVWPVISEALNVTIESQYIRREIAKKFRKICDRFFLCYAIGKSSVDTFISQAGVSKHQFRPVVRTFWNSERINGGLPSLENTEEVNTWEDAAANYLTFNPRAQLVLIADFQAYYATMYIRCRKGKAARNSFELAFYDLVRNRNLGQTTSSEIKFIPHLHWNEGVFAVMPQHAGSYSLLYIDPILNSAAPLRRLRSRQKWLLPSPWPKNLIIMHEKTDTEISVFKADTDILVFSKETGQHISTLESHQTGYMSLNENNIILVSQTQFSLSGLQSQQRGNLHVLEKDLAPGGDEIVFSNGKLGKVIVRPRIKARIFDPLPLQIPGRSTKVLGRASEIHIFTTQLQTKCWIQINDIPGIEVSFDEDLVEVLNVGDFIPPSAKALFVNITLKVSENGRVIQRLKLLFLPFASDVYENRFLQFEDGVSALTNFDLSKSDGVILQEHGAILDNTLTSEHAKVYLKIDQKTQSLIWPNTVDRIEYFLNSGQKQILMPGSTIEIGPKFNDEYVVLHCQNKDARLEVGGRVEERPFKNGRPYTIRLSEFLTRGRNADINVIMHEAKIPWLRVKRSLAPEVLNLRNRRASIRCSLHLTSPINFLILEFEDIDGATQTFTTSISHHPPPEALPPWISVEISQPGLKALIKFDKTKFDGLPSVCILKATTNSDGESFNITDETGGRCMIGLHPEIQLQEFSVMQLSKMGKWLGFRMHLSSERQLQESIGEIYASEINCLSQTSRHSQILSLYNNSISDIVVGFGKKIPAQIPEIFSYPNHAFVAFPERPENLAVNSFRKLYDLRNYKLIDAIRLEILGPHIASAYSNFARVMQKGGKLTGFEFKRLVDTIHELPAESKDFGVLTLDHYTSAIKLFFVRMSDLGFGEDFAPSQFETLRRLPTSLRNIPIDVILWPEEIFTTYEHSLQETVKLLSAFAKASRNGLAKEFIAQLSSATSIDEAKVTNCLALCIEAGLEVFSFYLLLWDIVKRNP